MILHALADDFNLTAVGDTERDAGMAFLFPYYLTDPSGNYLTDPSGNRLVGMFSITVYPQKLHSLPDDFSLTAE
jgi:hypothetical protein